MTLAGWGESAFSFGGRTYPTYRRGTGPGVVVVHEIPGITPTVEAFADEVVDAGFTVVLPSLFGTPGVPQGIGAIAKVMARVCISSEFVALHAGRTSPVTRWLGALADELHAELGGPGVGALGMCFTGGFALGMMATGPVVAPVLSQPSTPFPVTRRLRADLNLSPADLGVVKAKVAAGCQVLGLRYKGDPAVGTRFDTLRQELGEGFLAVELPGKGHSVVTEHRDEESVQRVLAFFREKLT
ncbi:MAG TPA: dienelactone hydrolase family protein [Mycobacteriales bacterium]|nr:dienelactone hydrolase family protein [Mycobacteriales bacterium]